jgi:hypothetical protein
MGVACPPRRNARDGKGKAKRKMSRITVRAETDFPSGESLETTQQRVVARFPSPPNTLRSVPGVDVASPFHTVFTVNFMTPMHAIAAYNPVQAGLNRGHGVFRFAENPHLYHVSGFPIVGGGFKAGGDDNPQGVLVEDVAVAHSRPPRLSMRATRAIRRMNPRAQSGPWKRG